MKEQYGIKEYKELLESALKRYDNLFECPFGMDPYSYEATLYRKSKQEILCWCLEMLPEESTNE